MLYGRNDEQARISSLLAAARDRGRSGALLLRGEAGIGKSALLAEAAALLPADGPPHVLRVTGVEAESGIAYAGLTQLLWPVRDRLEALPAPQAAALRSALGGPGAASADRGSTDPASTDPASTDPGSAGAGRDRFTTGLAVLTLLADLPDGNGPALVLVDDAQWLDTATADALLFAARRLAVEGVVILFAARDDAFTGTGLPELRLDRLGRGDAERLLAVRELPPTVRGRVIREAAGNPLALQELGAVGTGTAHGSDPLPVADRVLASFRMQIGHLPESTRLMLLIAAAEGRGHMPTMLNAGRSMGVGLDDLQEAERVRLVNVTGRSIAFRHPLIRAASYHGAVTAQRVAVHRALADTATDPDCRARHRASAAMAPDEDVAADVEDAAERARAHKGYATAAALYRQAADLTPAPGARAARLGTAASMVLQAGRLDEAEDLAVQAEKLTTAPAELARLARVHATVEYERGDPRAASRMMVDHAAEAAPADRAAMLRTGAVYGWTSGELPAVLRAAELLPEDRTIRGLALLANGDDTRGIPVLNDLVTETREASSSGRGAGRGVGVGDRVRGAQVALIIGADEAALELAAAEVAYSRRHGLIGALPHVLQTLAQAQIAAGRHADAEAAVAEAIALARDTGRPHREGRLGAVLARPAAIEGDETRLRELIAKTPPPGDGLAASALALLDLGLGRYDDALRRLEELANGHQRHSTACVTAAPDQVEAAVRSGQLQLARTVFARFRTWAEAGGQSWALAVSLRCEALLTDDEEPYARAVQLHERSTRPFERARTELLYGEWLRRARRRSDARTPLRSAAEIFERLRAAPWLERTRAELRATGESGPAVPTAPDLLDRLTPQELQVVRLAASGTSSREIAAQLFLSPRTVEYHLYKAYPKLGISSRKELANLALEPA
ncbi:AAA family ATPase [Actinomadura livida]|uniref:DNA-binding CsgD family transcriptional regulator/NACalpha-BTF3-like transcription factor n=1 Tax=Actinomadura livida TaxID=79909 RepID=A0A7W7I914_9ACTN|nr:MULTISPECIES: LuxR family transcriptional regulator [Actinomadura]MBB4772751.1 DNA-binding CsgD family transcriptional regulator/NACalpha-BTF3-like transcription factor [Actinomadura catellatispora]GGU12489.1 transcriptional regulator [Actinomadura livida]